MEHHVRLPTVLNDTGFVHVTVGAVLPTVCGLGTPGVPVMVAACRTEPERCVFHETQVVEERRVRVEGTKLEAVTLACKLHLFFYLLAFSREFYRVVQSLFLKACPSRRSFCFRARFMPLASSSLELFWGIRNRLKGLKHSSNQFPSKFSERIFTESQNNRGLNYTTFVANLMLTLFFQNVNLQQFANTHIVKVIPFWAKLRVFNTLLLFTLSYAFLYLAQTRTIVAVTHRPFTVVKGLFTSGNSQIVCDRHFPG